jgi:hypothetical protein
LYGFIVHNIAFDEKSARTVEHRRKDIEESEEASKAESETFCTMAFHVEAYRLVLFAVLEGGTVHRSSREHENVALRLVE